MVTAFAQSSPFQGFCLPKELMEDSAGEGATQFHDYEGGGIGDGEGMKDVSDQIENEEQVRSHCFLKMTPLQCLVNLLLSQQPQTALCSPSDTGTWVDLEI